MVTRKDLRSADEDVAGAGAGVRGEHDGRAVGATGTEHGARRAHVDQDRLWGVGQPVGDRVAARADRLVADELPWHARCDRGPAEAEQQPAGSVTVEDVGPDRDAGPDRVQRANAVLLSFRSLVVVAAIRRHHALVHGRGRRPQGDPVVGVRVRTLTVVAADVGRHNEVGRVHDHHARPLVVGRRVARDGRACRVGRRDVDAVRAGTLHRVAGDGGGLGVARHQDARGGGRAHRVAGDRHVVRVVRGRTLHVDAVARVGPTRHGVSRHGDIRGTVVHSDVGVPRRDGRAALHHVAGHAHITAQVRSVRCRVGVDVNAVLASPTHDVVDHGGTGAALHLDALVTGVETGAALHSEVGRTWEGHDVVPVARGDGDAPHSRLVRDGVDAVRVARLVGSVPVDLAVALDGDPIPCHVHHVRVRSCGKRDGGPTAQEQGRVGRDREPGVHDVGTCGDGQQPARCRRNVSLEVRRVGRCRARCRPGNPPILRVKFGIRLCRDRNAGLVEKEDALGIHVLR